MIPAENLATVSAAPRSWRHRGRDYLVSRITPRAAGLMQQLISECVPDPRKLARELMEGHTLEMQKYIYDKACEEAKAWPPYIDSPAGLAVLLGEQGMGLLVHVALHANHPEITRESAAAFASEMAIDELQGLLALMLPEGAKGPKAEAQAATSARKARPGAR